MPSIFICSVAKQCLHWLRFILCVHWKWELGVELAVPNRESAPTQYNKYKCHMDIGYCKRTTRTQLSTIFLGTNNFFYLSFYAFTVFLSTHILSQSSTMGHAKRTNEQSKWTKYYDFICNMPDAWCTMHKAEATAATFAHRRLVRLIEPDEMCLLCIGRFRCPHTCTHADGATTTFPARPTRAASHCDAVNSTIGTNWLSFYWRVLLAKGVLMVHVTINCSPIRHSTYSRRVESLKL